MRYAVLLLLLCSIPCVTAVQDGTATIEYLATDPSCSSVLTENVIAGETFYVRVLLENTGDEDLINAVLFVIDKLGNNHGQYTHPQQFVDIAQNNTITYCYPMETLTTYQSGEWVGRFYFRNFNRVNLDAIQFFRFNVTNDDVYEAVTQTINVTTIIAAPGEQVDIEATWRNENPDAPLTATLIIQKVHGETQATFPDGSTRKTVTIPDGGMHNEVLTTSIFTEPYSAHIGLHVEGSQSNELIRKWYPFTVTGNFYQYKVYQLYTDKFVYEPGESGTIDAYIRNFGNVDWDGSCCSYQFKVRARTPSGLQDIYDETFTMSATHAIKDYAWYTTTFTNTLDTVMSEYYVYFYPLKADGTPMALRNGLTYSYYSPDNFPDITDSCSVGEYTTPSGIVRQRNCSAKGSTTVFVRNDPDSPTYTISMVEGTMNVWWKGTANGNEGYFLQGSADATYQLEALLFRAVELDGFTLNVFVLVLSLAMLLFFWRR